jgi:hypothetical protein
MNVPRDTSSSTCSEVPLAQALLFPLAGRLVMGLGGANMLSLTCQKNTCASVSQSRCVGSQKASKIHSDCQFVLIC